MNQNRKGPILIEYFFFIFGIIWFICFSLAPKIKYRGGWITLTAYNNSTNIAALVLYTKPKLSSKANILYQKFTFMLYRSSYKLYKFMLLMIVKGKSGIYTALNNPNKQPGGKLSASQEALAPELLSL